MYIEREPSRDTRMYEEDIVPATLSIKTEDEEENDRDAKKKI